jgi:hypothetical protein
MTDKQMSGNQPSNAGDTQDPHLKSPAVQGEEGIGGSATSIDEDDDVTEMNQNVGLAMDEKEGEPQEVSLADDINKAEQAHRDG